MKWLNLFRMDLDINIYFFHFENSSWHKQKYGYVVWKQKKTFSFFNHKNILNCFNGFLRLFIVFSLL